MSTIQRLRAGNCRMLPEPTGLYVRYTDHCAALAAVEKERDEALAVLRNLTAATRRFRLLQFDADAAEVDNQEAKAKALLARHAAKEAR